MYYNFNLHAKIRKTIKTKRLLRKGFRITRLNLSVIWIDFIIQIDKMSELNYYI